MALLAINRVAAPSPMFMVPPPKTRLLLAFLIQIVSLLSGAHGYSYSTITTSFGSLIRTQHRYEQQQQSHARTTTKTDHNTILFVSRMTTHRPIHSNSILARHKNNNNQITQKWSTAAAVTALVRSRLRHGRSSSYGVTNTGVALQLGNLPPEVWTCLLPPFLGYYKSEYTVSYAYGLSTALSALVVGLSFTATTNLVVWGQALALLFYGTRLSIFLAIRELLSDRMKKFNDKIEERAEARGNRFVTRTPFALSCGLLYYGLCAPLFLTNRLLPFLMLEGNKNKQVLQLMLQGLIALQWFGYLMAAVGDFTKTWVKQSERNESFLVTSGIYSILRHPNYTGEILAWTAHALAGVLAVAATFRAGLSSSSSLAIRSVLSWKDGLDLTSLALGWFGIVFVLLRATRNLEVRQEESYGKDTKYQDWIESTWSGWMLPRPATKEEDEKESSDRQQE